MDDLIQYIIEHTIRGSCKECIDKPPSPEEHQPKGRTADVQFFKVSLKNNPLKEELIRLITMHKSKFKDVDLFDGREHTYVEVGGWIGDQELALMLMGMGELLEIWELYTPNRLMPDVSEDLRSLMARKGFITIQYKRDKEV